MVGTVIEAGDDPARSRPHPEMIPKDGGEQRGANRVMIISGVTRTL